MQTTANLPIQSTSKALCQQTPDYPLNRKCDQPVLYKSIVQTIVTHRAYMKFVLTRTTLRLTYFCSILNLLVESMLTGRHYQCLRQRLLHWCAFPLRVEIPDATHDVPCMCFTDKPVLHTIFEIHMACWRIQCPTLANKFDRIYGVLVGSACVMTSTRGQPKR